jgi:hypothetical protein
MPFLQIPGLVGSVLTYAALILQGFAFVHCLFQPTAAFTAADKWTKPGWAVVTGLAVVVTFLTGLLSLFGVVGIIASIVYIVDVRPAVREVSGGRGGAGGRDSGRW